MIDTMTTYEEFNELREKIKNQVSSVKKISDEIELSESFRNNLERMEHIVASEMFKVMVIGSFSRGKSTLINALLGEKILPAKLTPTTAVITILKYGPTPRAILYYKEKLDEPVEIPIEQLKQYLEIPRSYYKNDDSRISSSIEMVEIYYPLDLCKNGVEIVDSPGLEEDEVRQRITLQFLNKCDAAIVVLSCLQLLTLPEEHFIREELLQRGFDHLFYVLNYGDSVTKDDEDDLWDRVTSKLGKQERSFLVSSKYALQGKLTNDQVLLQESNFMLFELELENFLVRESGKVKIKSSQKILMQFINDLIELLNIKLNILEKSKLEDLEHLEKNSLFVRNQFLKERNM